MLLVANFGITKLWNKPEKWLKPWHMGIHLRDLGESFLMNTNMTGFGWFSKIIDVLGLSWHVVNECLYNHVLADVQSTGEGIKCLYCSAQSCIQQAKSAYYTLFWVPINDLILSNPWIAPVVVDTVVVHIFVCAGSWCGIGPHCLLLLCPWLQVLWHLRGTVYHKHLSLLILHPACSEINPFLIREP